MSADTMPCGCEGHFDNLDDCDYPKLVRAAECLLHFAQHHDKCEWWHGAACSCGLVSAVERAEKFVADYHKRWD